MNKQNRWNLYCACFVVSLALWGLWPDRIIWIPAWPHPIPVPVWGKPPPAMAFVGKLLGIDC